MYQSEIENLQQINIRHSKIKLGVLLLASGFLAALMFTTAYNGSITYKIHLANIIGFVFLALGFLKCYYLIFDFGRLKLTRHNLEIIEWSGSTYISWDDIQDFSIFYLRGIPYVSYNPRVSPDRDNTAFEAFLRRRLLPWWYEVKTKDLVDLLNSYQSSVLKSDRTIVYKF